MRTSNDWMKELNDLYDGQKNGRIKAPQAVEMNNTVGKVINLAKVQLEYQVMRLKMPDSFPKIPVLESGK